MLLSGLVAVPLIVNLRNAGPVGEAIIAVLIVVMLMLAGFAIANSVVVWGLILRSPTPFAPTAAGERLPWWAVVGLAVVPGGGWLIMAVGVFAAIAVDQTVVATGLALLLIALLPINSARHPVVWQAIARWRDAADSPRAPFASRRFGWHLTIAECGGLAGFAATIAVDLSDPANSAYFVFAMLAGMFGLSWLVSAAVIVLDDLLGGLSSRVRRERLQALGLADDDVPA